MTERRFTIKIKHISESVPPDPLHPLVAEAVQKDMDVHGAQPLKAAGKAPEHFDDPAVFVTPDGSLVTSQFGIGPESHHQAMFITYTRTFGQVGTQNEADLPKAFAVTHEYTDAGLSPEKLKDIRSAWQNIARYITEEMPGGYQGPMLFIYASPERAAQFIGWCTEFRRHYPELYSDVPCLDTEHLR